MSGECDGCGEHCLECTCGKDGMMETASDREPFYGYDWIGEFFVHDLRELATELRSKADFLDGKAALLERQMSAASVAATPTKDTPNDR